MMVDDLGEGAYYVVPGYAAMMAMIELKETQDIASHMLKFCIERAEVVDWESSAVPDMAELYSGSRACIQMLEHMMEQEPPPQYREKITDGGLCISGEQYVGFVALMETMRTLKKSIETHHNISFEIH